MDLWLRVLGDGYSEWVLRVSNIGREGRVLGDGYCEWVLRVSNIGREGACD